MTRIAFTADLHVDAYGSRLDPATGLNARLVDYLRTVRFVSVEAMERGCDALVIAGDFTERRHPAPWLVSKIQDALEEGPSELVVLRGNHDGEIAGSSIVTVMEAGIRAGHGQAFVQPGIVMVGARAPGPGTAIAAIPYLDRHWLRAQPGFAGVPDAEVYGVLGDQFLTIARGLHAQAHREHPDAEGVVLVCHQTLAGAAMSDSQQAFLGDLALVVDSRALADIGFEAVVAGHLHRHQVVAGPGDRPVLYAGSIERVDFGEEHEIKGFVVADVGPGRFEWEFVETPARRMVTLTGADIEADVAEATVEGAIVRVVDLDPSLDVAHVRTMLESLGAFEVQEIRRRPVAAPEAAGGMAEGLSAEQALVAYFADEPDADAVVERGREILEAVA